MFSYLAVCSGALFVPFFALRFFGGLLRWQPTPMILIKTGAGNDLYTLATTGSPRVIACLRSGRIGFGTDQMPERLDAKSAEALLHERIWMFVLWGRNLLLDTLRSPRASGQFPRHGR